MSTTQKDRIKRVFPNIQGIVHLWAHQSQDDARCANAYFEGDTIFSYGRHFPIARIYMHPKTKEKKVLFTNRRYSNTTAKHIGAVRSAVSHMDKLFMENVPIGAITKNDHEGNINQWKRELEEQFVKLERARKKEIYIDKIRAIVREMNLYIEFFGIKVDKKLKAILEETNQESFDAYLESEKKRIARDRRKQEKLYHEAQIQKAKEFDELLLKWRNFEPVRIYGRPYDIDYLRYNKEKSRIETSQGMEVPIGTAQKFYNHIKAVLHNGGCVTEESCMYKVLDYQVREITREHIRIGCHRILMSEVQAMVQQLGWK